MYFENTGKKWVAPSPNIPDNNTAFIYSGMCLIEGTNLSEGRGTDMPFRYFGAPWLDSEKLLLELSSINLQGVKFNKVEFIPRFMPHRAVYPKFMDQTCNGLEVIITDRNTASPLLVALNIIDIIYKIHPNDFHFTSNNFIDKLYGSGEMKNNIRTENNSIKSLIDVWYKDEENFYQSRKPFLIY